MSAWDFTSVDDYAKTLDQPADVPRKANTSPGGLAGKLGELMQQLGPGYTRYATPVNQFVQSAIQKAPLSGDPGTSAAVRGIADTVAPTTLEGAGKLAGFIAAARNPTWARSVLAPAAGSFAGSVMQGGPLHLGDAAWKAGLAGAEGLGGKLVQAGVGATIRGGHMSGFPSQQAVDEAAITKAIGEISPSLGGTKTAAELHSRMAQTGEQILSGEYQNVRSQIEAGMQGRQGYATPAPVPPPGEPGVTPPTAPFPQQSGFPTPLSDVPPGGSVQAGFPNTLSGNTISARPGGVLEQVLGKPTGTFDEAATAIELLKDGRHPLTSKLLGSEKAAAERTLSAQAAAELSTQIEAHDPVLAELYRDAERGAYGKGSELLRLFRENGIMDPAVRGLNVPKLQEFLSNLANRARLEKMLGHDGWLTLKEAVLRGAEPPAMDLPGASVPFLQRMRAGGGSIGTSEPIRFPTKYVGAVQQAPGGQLPYSLPMDWVRNMVYPNRRNPYASGQ